MDDSQVLDEMPSSMEFPAAFAEARKRGLLTFGYKGKRFSTSVADVAPPKPAEPNFAEPLPVNPIQHNPMQDIDPSQYGGSTLFPGSDVPGQGLGTQLSPDYPPPPFGANTLTPGTGLNMGASPVGLQEHGGWGTPMPTPQVDLSPPQDPSITATAQADPGKPPPPNVPPEMLLQQGQLSQPPLPAPIEPDGQQSPELGAMLGRTMPKEMVKGPASSPQEAEARIGGWQQVFDKIKGNPNLWMALIKTGSELIQPIAANQTPGGHMGRALQGGVDYLSALEEAQSHQRLREAQTGKASAETGKIIKETDTLLPAQAEHLGAQSGEAKARAEDLKADAVLKGLDANSRPELLQAQIKKLKADGALDESKAKEIETLIKEGQPAAAVDLLKAHSQYFREHVRQGTEKDKQYLELKKALRVTKYTDQNYPGETPDMLDAKATIEARSRMTAEGANADIHGETARSIVDLYGSQYDAIKATDPNNKRVKKYTREQYITSEIDSATLPPSTKAGAYALVRPQRPPGSASTPSVQKGEAPGAPSPSAVPTGPSASPSGSTGMPWPAAGTVRGGYVSNGGDPSKQETWTKK